MALSAGARVRVGDRVLRRFGDDEFLYVLARVVAVHENSVLGKHTYQDGGGDESASRDVAGADSSKRKKSAAVATTAESLDDQNVEQVVDLIDLWHSTLVRHENVPISNLRRITGENHRFLTYTGTAEEKEKFRIKIKSPALANAKRLSSAAAASASAQLKIVIPKNVQRMWALYAESLLDGGEPPALPWRMNIDKIFDFWLGILIDRKSLPAEYEALVEWLKAQVEILIPQVILPTEVKAYAKILKKKKKPHFCSLFGAEHLVACLLELQRVVLEEENKPQVLHSDLYKFLSHHVCVQFINGLCAYIFRAQEILFTPDFTTLPAGVVPPNLDQWRKSNDLTKQSEATEKESTSHQDSKDGELRGETKTHPRT